MLRSPDAELNLLLEALGEAFDKKSWHGPNLRGSLRGVAAGQAAWRPQGDRHNIWELTLHAAYWKYAVRRKLSGARKSSFVLKGSNFFPRPVELSEAAWKSDIAILEAEHEALVSAVAGLAPAWRRDPGKWRAARHLIRGAAAHDLYHAGQIRLIRRMLPSET